MTTISMIIVTLFGVACLVIDAVSDYFFERHIQRLNDSTRQHNELVRRIEKRLREKEVCK